MKRSDNTIDYAIQYNSDHHESPVAEVLHEITGENDGNDWHWLVKLENGRFAYAWGGCDYTGWDCRSNMYYKDSRATLEEALGDVPPQDNNNRNVNEIFTDMIAKGEEVRDA